MLELGPKWERNIRRVPVFLVSFVRGGVMATERDPDWRAAIERLREESNHVLREIWAAKRRGLDDPEDEDAAADDPPARP